ncbi:HAD family hydrolase [Lacrimispora sp.]|uniref:HAD family hydrolase n=1 Tax=Lacrimispora sp. TaxID=2719234 RepID=UPI00345FCD5F
MIKNIVFDMGKVLVNYEGNKVCHHFIEDEAERKAVSAAVFDSPEWIFLDMGLMPEETALKKMQARLETDHAKEMAALCMKHWHEYNLWPIEGMEELVAELKEKGYGIYLCSNASLRLLECSHMIPGISHFDGTLFSAEVKYIKPQKEMYAHLFNRFGLKPEECFFIDDLPMNIEGARDCGMDGYCFADGDVKKLREVLSCLNESQPVL